MQIMNEAIEKKIEEFKERYRELNDNGSVDFRVTVGMWREAIDFGASLERTAIREMLEGMKRDTNLDDEYHYEYNRAIDDILKSLSEPKKK
jgi:hypothetical protein